MRPAEHALARLLRWSAGGATAALEAPPPLDNAGWRDLAALILEHRVAVTFGPELARWGMPQELALELAETGRRHRLRTQWLLLELRRILAALAEAGVPAVVLKGAALVQTLGCPRFFLDLDVLVPASALELAARSLLPLGYAVGQTGRSAAYYERHHFHRVLHSDEGVTLELHWDLARPSDYFHLDPDEVRARARSVPFDGITMQVPCQSDQLLHAAEQSLREGFSEARRVLDAARLLRAGAGDDPDLASRARRMGLGSALWSLLVATEALTGIGCAPLTGTLRPSTVRRTSLEALDLPSLLLERRADRLAGLRGWLLLLCAPSAGVTARTFMGVVFPGERGLLEDGHAPETGPGVLGRGLLSAKRIGQAAKLAAYQTWRLAPHLTSRATRGG